MKKIVLVLCALLPLTGCSSMSSINEYLPWYSGNAVESVGLQVQSSEQLDHAVSVDIVFAYDESTMALLTSASSEQWFTEKNGYLASYGPQMDVIQRQIVPGYNEHITALPGRSRLAKGVFAFALYPENSNSKAVLSTLPAPWLLFDATQMTVLSGAPVAQAEGQ